MSSTILINLEKYQTGNDIFDALIVAALLSIFTLVFFIVKSWVASSAKLRSLQPTYIKELEKYFVPNPISIVDQDGDDHTSDVLPQAKDSLDALVQHISASPQAYYFLVAPTGVGKTTFLANFYSRYKKKSRFSFLPPLLFGQIHKEETRDEITLMFNRNKESALDLLKFKLKRREKSILLLDGFDEFLKNNYLNQNDFWGDLNEDWNQIRTQLKGFGKVIIAVREQFLQQQDHGKIGLKGSTINNTEIRYLKLEHFKLEQIEAYIGKRYHGSGLLPKIQNTVDYFNRATTLSPDGTSLLSIPLILNYIQDLSQESLRQSALTRGRLFVNRYDVYSVIVNKWLAREKEFKSVGSTDLEESLKFCEELAFKFAGSADGYSISEMDFIKFEERFFEKISGTIHKSFITHFGDRSLLLKEGTSRQSNIRFAHTSFLEYFLAGYAYRMSKMHDADIVEIDGVLSRPSFSFARELLINWGWFDLKKKPELKPEAHVRNEQHAVQSWRNVPDVGSLTNWKKYIEQISTYPSIRTLLKSNLGDQLKQVDPDWEKEFNGISGIAITNDNFLDGRHPIQSVQECIPYLSDFITHIDLAEADLQNTNALSVFDGFKNLKWLSLQKLGISGDCLSYFKQSTLCLEYLILEANDFENNDLRCFNGADKLYVLLISYNNNLTSECLEYFEKSADILRGFSTDNNVPDANWLYLFDNSSQQRDWKIFQVSDIAVDIIFNNHLQESFDSLHTLTLSNSGIIDEWFNMFTYFNSLTSLNLSSNEKITGANFSKLSHLKETLTRLDFQHTSIESRYLEILLDFPQLKSLYLWGCPPQDENMLQKLRDKGIEVRI